MRAALAGLLLLAGLTRLLSADETNSIVTVDGVTYSNVTWGAVTPATVKISHSAGIAVLPLAKLPADLQQQFGYDPEKMTTHRDATGEPKLPALAEIKIAAEGGNPRAQYELGKTYEQHGDYESAGKWYALAAQKDLVEAEYAYAGILMVSGQSHENGKTISRNPDLAAAVQWYTKAALKGSRPAMVRLAHSYEEGLGVKQDLVEAYKWYTVAEKLEDKSVEPNLQKLILAMTSAEIIKAQKMADDLVAKQIIVSTNEVAAAERKSRMVAAGVGRMGITAFNVAGSPFGEYDKALIRAVQSRWYAIISLNGLYNRSGVVTLHFKLMRDGSVQDIEIKQNTAGEILGLFCQKAVVDTSPFPPLPEKLAELAGDNPRDVNFTFYY